MKKFFTALTATVVVAGMFAFVACSSDTESTGGTNDAPRNAANGGSAGAGTSGAGAEGTTPNVPPTEVTRERTRQEIGRDVDLRLPVSMVEQTVSLHDGNSFRISRDGVLYNIDRNGNDTIVATGVRHVVRNGVSSTQRGGPTAFWITDDNVLYTWGNTRGGLKGDGRGTGAAIEDRLQPYRLMENVADAQIMHYDRGIGFALQLDGTLHTWGEGIATPQVVATGVARITVDGLGSPGFQTKSGHFYSFIDGNGNLNRTNPTRLLGVSVYDIVTVTTIRVALYVNSDNELVRRNRAGYYEVIATNVLSVGGTGSGSYFITQDGGLWIIAMFEEFGQPVGYHMGAPVGIAYDRATHIADNVALAGDGFYLTTSGDLWTWDSSNRTPALAHSGVVHASSWGNFVHFADGRFRDPWQYVDDVREIRTRVW